MGGKAAHILLSIKYIYRVIPTERETRSGGTRFSSRQAPPNPSSATGYNQFDDDYHRPFEYCAG
jgi:hypothetical protein